MRTRVLVVLLALVAMAVVPAESLLAESAGSVVGQVASCIEPSGLVRGAEDGAATASCTDRLGGGSTTPLLVVTLLVGTAVVVAGVRRGGHRRPPEQLGRLTDAVPGPAVPWRAPPLPV